MEAILIVSEMKRRGYRGVQGDHHRSATLEPFGRILFQTPEYYVSNYQRNLGVTVDESRWGIPYLAILNDERRSSFRSKWRIAAEHGVQDTAEAVDVRAGIDFPGFADLLRTHIVRRSHGCAGHGHAALFVERLGDAEIHQQSAATAVQQHVGRFDIAMHDPLQVRVIQCA